MVRYYVNESLDPYSSMDRFDSLDDAKAQAVAVGHCHVFEYEVVRGVPGAVPESETLTANIYLTGDDAWQRDEVEVNE